ncbi:pyridoxal phosphate-dependent transferase [Pseudoneurospora amorphoporcata]|uniref:Pyridoxal phosphate-dependent transferase n=1 Tax=Pseudoneurospora amorphoporcata TaxID=241081 RepID=A0AAN6NQJ3_9PEZI|nr:pyridoxal phosphate-dependent transferase [Pseudoneurospora amorphoporcata]
MGENGIIQHPELLKLGESLPPGNPHGVSVHLPTWEDTLGWACRDRRVLDTMVTGYPRFFIPRVVERLADRLLAHFTQSHGHEHSNVDLKGKHALILSTGHHALVCRRFFRQKLDPDSPKVNFDILIAHWDGTITAVREDDDLPPRKSQALAALGQEDIFLLPYPVDMFPTAKAFWQHTGFGISSRRATYWMESAPFLQPATSTASKDQTNHVNHPSPTPFDKDSNAKALEAIRTRLANCYSTPSFPVANDDVLLYPAGMSSIAAVSSAIRSLVMPRLHVQTNGTRRRPSVALFGFLYVDTLKLLSSLLGFTFHLYPFSTPLTGPSSLSQSLESGKLDIDLLVTEFPGNPLLQSPDLEKLWELSKRYGFALVVDDTVGGTGANVNVLGKCDAVVSSLTKMVSGGCDVMGGCAVLSPSSGRYQELKGELWGSGPGAALTAGNEGMDGKAGSSERNAKRDSGYAAAALEGDGEEQQEIKNEGKEETERSWFPSDITTMNHNSRNFIHRVRHASSNANWLVHHLLRPHASVQEVYYPKGSSTERIYEQFRVKPTSTPTDNIPVEEEEEEGGYGFLVSIKFKTPAKARAFYDALHVAKGPSLGTNFTLCCAYTLLAHYRELEWAAEFGVVEDLVRISVGLEEREWLGKRVGRALKAAGECQA